MNETTADVDVVVVGGGIGGLANAYALTQAGQRVRVLEQAPAFGEVGAGLQMAPNATRILREWGLLDEVVARGVLPRRLVMRDAIDGTELTHLDLRDAEQRYGAPYAVIHRSDLHAILLAACQRAGVDLVTGCTVNDVEIGVDRSAVLSETRRDEAAVVLAADGLRSALRGKLSDDQPISSAYVAYRGAVPIADVKEVDGLAMQDVVVYLGPGCHLVQYPLRQGEMFNQVAVFESPSALRGAPDWGTPDELDAAFAGTCDQVRRGLASLWRDRWWPMYDRRPISTWVDRRFALTGDAAHPMLQYLAQGACQALEDADCLSTLVAKQQASRTATADGTGPSSDIDWDTALLGYQDLRTARTARVQTTARAWGELWHCDGLTRSIRNALLADRSPTDYRHVDWLYAH